MTKNFLEKFKNNYEFILVGFLWICVWATYNTDIFRFFNYGFPNNFFDLIHGIRSFFPFVALIISIFILIKNKKFDKNFLKSPMGLLFLYSVVGTTASIFSKNVLGSFYWGILYGSVIIILFAIAKSPNFKSKIIFLIKINFIIAAIISIGLLIFFLIQPGVVSSFTYNFLICYERPYETFAEIKAETNTFDMAGTRPTGWGRYAGFLSVVFLTIFFCSKKEKRILWFLLFLFFLFTLLFSKGKTEIISFFIVAILIIWWFKKINILSLLGLFLIFLIAILIIFYKIPCENSFNFLSYINSSQNANLHQSNSKNLNPQIILKDIKTISTLSGRTSGVWKDSINLFYSSPIIGYGFQADRFFLNGQHTHNSILHALVQSGILGTLFFVLAYLSTFIILLRLFKIYKVKEEDKKFLLIFLFVLIFFGIRSITESVAFFSADWLFVAPIIAYTQFLYEDKKQEKNNFGKSPSINFCDIKIDVVSIKDVLNKIDFWINSEKQKTHWIVATGMHGIVEAHRNRNFKKILSFADLFVPDGISLIMVANLKGYKIKKRISGPDLMTELLKNKNYSHFLYGDTNETLSALKEKFSDNKIVGMYSPTLEEVLNSEKNIENINNANPDILWVGLGLPKQEKWIFQNKDKLNVPAIIGVGAAFKFLSGKVKRAPKWVGDLGFEWLWRLFCEPKKTWKRVFVYMPIFFYLVLKDFLNLNKK